MVWAALLAFRWPVFFLPDTRNLDESQLISGARTLRRDPVFWRAIEGRTIGPLDHFALIPARRAQRTIRPRRGFTPHCAHGQGGGQRQSQTRHRWG